MSTLPIIGAVVLLGRLAGFMAQQEKVTPGARADLSESVGAAAAATPALRCPLSDWRGRCAYMREAEKDMIRRAVAIHVRTTAAECLRVKEVLLKWLDPGRPLVQVWVFEAHAMDEPASGSYVFGQTAHGVRSGKPVGFGIRAAVFRAESQVLARIVLHEAAHLAGEAEVGASRTERRCVPPAREHQDAETSAL